jgi:hypothetical protein
MEKGEWKTLGLCDFVTLGQGDFETWRHNLILWKNGEVLSKL